MLTHFHRLRDRISRAAFQPYRRTGRIRLVSYTITGEKEGGNEG
jgi:hypothetical protein